MADSYKKASFVALAFHILLLLSLAVVMIKAPESTPSQPYIFTIVEAPVLIPGEIEAEPPALRDVQLPTIDHTPLPELPDIDELMDALNQEEPEAAPPAKPEPEVAQPKPTPKAAAPVEKMSYDAFVKKQGKPKESKLAAKTTAQSKSKKVDAQKVKKDLADVLKPTGNLAGATANGKGDKALAAGPVVSASALAAFNASLLKKIDTAWIKPSGDIPDGLSTVVEFYVAPNGAISNIRVVQTSANAAVDRSVLAAFTRVANAGKPPHAQGGTYRLKFSVK